MIGMINAVGATQSHRSLTENTQTRSSALPDVGEPPMWIREPKTAEGQTESARAVQPVEFQESQAEDRLPSTDQTEVADRAQREVSADPHLGQRLDTSA